MIDLHELRRVALTRFVAQYGRQPDMVDDADALRCWSMLPAKERAAWRAQDRSAEMTLPETVARTVAHEVIEQGRMAMFYHDG